MAHPDALTVFYPLSKALRSKKLYIDTMLHAHHKAASLRRMRERGSYERTNLINFLGLFHHVMQNTADASIKTSDAAFDALQQKLRNIPLVPIITKPDGRGFQATATSFSNAASYRGRQPIQPPKTTMQAEQLSRLVWAQNITQRLDHKADALWMTRITTKVYRRESTC